MKNSIGYFEAVWLFIWNMITKSCIYKILKKVYDCISGAWRNSRIVSWFRVLHTDDDALEKSVAGKVLRCPFTFIEFLQKKIGVKVNKLIEESLFFNICRDYLNNILAINLRFIGTLMLSMAAGIIAYKLIAGGAIGMVIIIAAIVGAVLIPFNVNVTEYLKGSALVSLVCNLLGIDADFNWFDKKYTEGKGRIAVAAVAGVVIGFASSAINPLLAPVALVAIAAVMLVLQRPSAGAMLLLLAAPIAPTMADAGIAILCLISMVVYAITHNGFKFKFDGMGFFIIAFIAVYLVAAITSFAVIKSLSIWMIYFVFMAMYFVIINTAKSKKLLNNMLTIFVLSGLLVCVYGIAQYIFGWDTKQAWMDEEMFEDIKMRIYSTLENPNVLGEYILIVLPVSIGLMWTRKKFASKVVYAGISAIMGVALILTFSRGCWVGLLVAAAVFVTFAAGKLWGLALVALPILPFVLPESIINRFTSIGNMEDSSTSYRVYIWMGTLAMIKDFWLSGIGMGQEAFTQVYPFYSYNGIIAPHSHNLFLQILVESGVVGIGVFLIISVLFLRRIMTGYQYGGKGDSLSTIMTAIAAGFCGFLVQGMFDNSFYNYRVVLIFWCVLALGRACVYVAKQRSEDAE